MIYVIVLILIKSVCLLPEIFLRSKRNCNNFADIFTSTERTFRQFSGYVGHYTWNNLENSGNVTFIPLRTGFLLLCFQGNPCLLSKLRDNGWTDLRDILCKGQTWDKEQPDYFRDVAVNPLNPGWFPGSVIINNFMEKWVNGCSWNFHEMPGTIQEIII